MLSEKFKPLQKETILSLQYCKLITEEEESAGEGMKCVRVKANECEYRHKMLQQRVQKAILDTTKESKEFDDTVGKAELC